MKAEYKIEQRNIKEYKSFCEMSTQTDSTQRFAMWFTDECWSQDKKTTTVEIGTEIDNSDKLMMNQILMINNST